MIFRHKIKVRYVESDQMGVVHHSNYPIYFEEARVHWLEEFDLAYHQLEKDGLMLPIYDLQLKHHAPAYFGDTLSVEVNLSDLRPIKLKFDYRIFNQNQKLITTGSTVLVFMSAGSRKPVRCPKELYQKLQTAL
jgi:acyl-CoA thioester hydrolase